ncbi:hypothetical protein DM860_013817 [Cuscuta australis]|uniref:Uncharacterized protein n=1 Tax=Cuscuta australis TaxID=267555 RepID=A0A328DMI6_9ASTE|nr:hypothetical protein DM860_013817 [Cuscuta australis]
MNGNGQGWTDAAPEEAINKKRGEVMLIKKPSTIISVQKTEQSNVCNGTENKLAMDLDREKDEQWILFTLEGEDIGKPYYTLFYI